MPDIILDTNFNNPRLPVVQYPGFVDNFNAADGALDVTNDGKPWAFQGTSTVFARAGGAAKQSAGSGFAFAVVDGLSADGTLTQVIRTVGNHVGGVTIRNVDVNNCYYLGWRVSGGDYRYQLIKRVAGVNTQLGLSTGATSADGDSVAVEFEEDAITVKINGVTRITATGQTDFLTATKHGLYGAGDFVGLTESLAFFAA